MEQRDLLRQLPPMDRLLGRLEARAGHLPAQIRAALAREAVDALRAEIRSGRRASLPDLDALCWQILDRAGALSRPSLRPVINATGVVLHTNLGRAPLSPRAVEAAVRAAEGYSNLEYDLPTGGRGSRHSHVEGLLCRLTGAEGALVVNNNAAALLLMLTAVAAGGEVVVSRGELVEIGGSFRIPDIAVQCGCRLREVGSTNKTRLGDYRQGAAGEARALLKVHTSNYRIVGFTASVSLAELVGLGRELGLPVLHDLGSGCLAPLPGLPAEPTAADSVAAGADLVCFSGDKLLGGPQAGIIVGKGCWLDRLKAHPLARALRVDKLTLAALEATLACYLDPARAAAEIPALKMLTAPSEALRRRAEDLCRRLEARQIPARAVAVDDPAGGGSLPGWAAPGWAAAVDPPRGAARLDRALRGLPLPIVGRISKGQYLLHVRTLSDGDLDYIARQIEEAILCPM